MSDSLELRSTWGLCRSYFFLNEPLKKNSYIINTQDESFKYSPQIIKSIKWIHFLGKNCVNETVNCLVTIKNLI